MRSVQLSLVVVWFLWKLSLSMTCEEGKGCMGTHTGPPPWSFVEAYDTKDGCVDQKVRRTTGYEADAVADDAVQASQGRTAYGMVSVRYTCLPAGLDSVRAGE
jgi:hypothetical protein